MLGIAGFEAHKILVPNPLMTSDAEWQRVLTYISTSGSLRSAEAGSRLWLQEARDQDRQPVYDQQ